MENITGAGSNIATDRVAKAAPDGYTLLMGGNSALVDQSRASTTSCPMTPSRISRRSPRCSSRRTCSAVPPGVPAKTLPELVALARAQPGKLTYGHAGVGTSQHLGGELLKYMAHVDIQPVAYRGTTAVLPDLLAGRLTMSFANISNALPLVREGKLTAFAVSSRERSAAAPDIPTMAELGYPGFDAVPWFGLLAPAGTPPAVIDKVHRETVRVLALPEVQASLRHPRARPDRQLARSSSPTVIKAEIPQWAAVIRGAGIRAQPKGLSESEPERNRPGARRMARGAVISRFVNRPTSCYHFSGVVLSSKRRGQGGSYEKCAAKAGASSRLR